MKIIGSLLLLILVLVAPFSLAFGDDTFLFPNSHEEKLTNNMIWGLKSGQHPFARNEIFARRGYIFKNDKYRQYFSKKSWYKPTVKNASTIKLTPIEAFNVKYLLFWDPEVQKKDNERIKLWIDEKLGISDSYKVQILDEKSKISGGQVLKWDRWEISNDLNGDGQVETISFKLLPEGSKRKVVLEVNGSIGEEKQHLAYENFYLLDLFQDDTYKELAIMGVGPGDDIHSSIYRYDGKNLIEMLQIESSVEGLATTKDGKLIAGFLNHSTGKMGVAIFKLDPSHTFALKDESYPVYKQIFTKIPIRAFHQYSDQKQSESVEIKENEILLLLSMTDGHICEVETPSGKRYWLNQDVLTDGIINTVTGEKVPAKDAFEGWPWTPSGDMPFHPAG
jgi:hypothetical protein